MNKKEQLKKKNIELLETMYNEKMLPVFFTSLISSDTLVGPDVCDECEKVASNMLSVLPDANIPEDVKVWWKKKFEDALEIIKKEREEF